MTLTELRNRLTGIIEENKARGWAERNDSKMVVEHKVGKRVTEFHLVKYVCSSWLGVFNGHGLGLCEEHENYFNIVLGAPVARYGGIEKKIGKL